MLGWFGIFGIAIGIVAGAAAATALGLLSNDLAERVHGRIAVLASVIGASVAAALLSVAFVGQALIATPDPDAMFSFQPFGDDLLLLIWLLFGATGGLFTGLAVDLTSQPNPGRRSWHRFWRRFGAGCLVWSGVIAAVLPVAAFSLILSTVDSVARGRRLLTAA